MSSFLSLSNIDVSCSEIELIVSSVSINSSYESSSLSALSLAFPSFNFLHPENRSFLVRTSGGSISSFSYAGSNNFSHVLFVTLEVKGGQQTE